MKGEKDSGSDDGKAEIPKVALLDAKNFEESVKTGNLYSLSKLCSSKNIEDNIKILTKE